MRIVYYTDQIYMHGGLERVLFNKLSFFHRNTDFDLHVVTFQQKNNPPCYPIPQEVTLHDIGIDYNRDVSFLSLSNAKHALKHYSKLKKVIKKINPDIIVVCNYEFGFYFLPFIAKKSTLIKEYHSSRFFNFQKRIDERNFIKKSIFKITDFFEKKYDYLIVLTKDELAYYKSNNALVIPNFISSKKENNSNLNNKRAISAGRIAPVKGFEHLINAWKYVADKYPDWKLDIYGDGDIDYVTKLADQIKNSGLENNVFINKAINSLENEMLDSSIYVMSSLTECFPMVLLESMTCGLPIVSFDCPNGPRNIIKNNEDGLLVEYLNPDELAIKIIYLIETPEERKKLGESAKNNVRKFSEEKIMNEWLNLFKRNNSLRS